MINLNWKAEFYGTIQRPDGAKCDMWVIAWDEKLETLVSLGVPKGRQDIVEYIVSRCKTH